MIVYIYGADTFNSREYLKYTVDQFKKARDPHGYNTAILDGQKESLDKILSELKSAPFLSERRMVVLENILSNKDKELLAGLLNFLIDKKIPESNVLLVWQGEKTSIVKESKDLQTFLSKEKFAREFKTMNEMEAVSWAQKKIEAGGGKIERPALNYLCQNVDGDTWLLNSLINQLLYYKNGAEINLSDTQLFLEEKAVDDIFAMAESVAEGNRKKAFKLVEDQRRLGQEDGLLFSMILRQFKILLEIRDLFEREDNLRSDDMAKMLKLHPFVVKKSLPLVKRYSLQKLKDIYKELLDIDIGVKTGRIKQGLAIDFFIGKN